MTPMMPTIYKYPIEVVDEQVLELPGMDARPLTVQTQRGMPCLWAIVDRDAPPNVVTRVQLRIAGTGHSLRDGFDGFAPRAYRYLTTFQMDNGALVFHVFYR